MCCYTYILEDVNKMCIFLKITFVLIQTEMRYISSLAYSLGGKPGYLLS